MSYRTSIFDSIGMLALIGILAGALGGLGVGLVSHPSTSNTGSSSSSTH